MDGWLALLADRLYAFLRRPLPPLQANALVASDAFAALAKHEGPSPLAGLTCTAVAALMPAERGVAAAG